MVKSIDIGMQTFDQSLYQLYSDGKISIEEALNNADSRNNLLLKIRLSKGMNEERQDDGLSLNDDGLRTD